MARSRVIYDQSVSAPAHWRTSLQGTSFDLFKALSAPGKYFVPRVDLVVVVSLRVGFGRAAWSSWLCCRSVADAVLGRPRSRFIKGRCSGNRVQ